MTLHRPVPRRLAPRRLAPAAALIAALLPLSALATEGLAVTDAWTTAGDGTAAQVYMRIENAGEGSAELVAATAEGARMATFVISPARAEGGVPETLDGILLQPGMDAVLRPNGLHVRLHGLDAPLEEGDEIEMTLTFVPQGEMTVTVRVEAADATASSGG